MEGIFIFKVLGASEVSAILYCNSRTSVLGRLRDYETYETLCKKLPQLSA